MTAPGRSSRNAEGILVAAVAMGHTQREAAELANVSERTVRRRMSDRPFAEAVRTARRDMIDRACAQLLGRLEHAITALVELLGSESETIRYRAACALIDKAGALWQTHEVEERLAALENAAAESNRAER